MVADRSIVTAALVLVAVPWLAGCGKKGDPLPPEPRGPFPPQAVTARQIGDRLVVHFTVPSPRGEKPAQEPIEAELVRVYYPPGEPAPPDPDAFRRRGRSITRIAADPLASGERVALEDDLTEDAPERLRGWTVRYGVRVMDRRGRPSPLVSSEDIVPIDPPPPPASPVAAATAAGVRLEWTPVPDRDDARYNVYRGPVGGEPGERPVNPVPIPDDEFVDSTVALGESYVYTVRTVTDPSTPFRESEPSEGVEVLAEDRFPPGAPAGVVAVQEGTAVRLFWNPNVERDLGGYRVYRRRGDEPWRRINVDTVTETLFLDSDVRIGDRCAYRITAFDQVDPPNESPPSEEVVIVIAAEPTFPGEDDP